ncbi:PilC/PilY family type IV pilus protein [Variovorax sp. GB1P17]|uniref:PilC/PilY family type IV pilus protein n=1 Tax=Variovorax sp. GB1P17 TaxID=3443740 RepID=UPI003F445FE7
MNRLRTLLACLVCMLAGAPWSAHAQLIISDTLTGASSTYDWTALNGACLTAGNDTGPIPACIGKLTYYTDRNSLLVGGTTGRLPDAVGSGALRLTNGDTQNGGSNGDNQTGAVVANKPFYTNQGLQVTFTTVTYGGDGNNGTGADGISFFLADGAKAPSVGGLGGSLGYSCSNTNSRYEGVVGGYLGIGIDEYGNFSNPGDNTATGPGFKAGRISVRGAGNITWASLNALDPVHYPSSLSSDQQTAAVKATCKSGVVMDYSTTTTTTCKKGKCTTTTTGPSGNATTTSLPDYPLLLNGTAYSDLPSGVSISNQQGISKPLRGNATPITYGLQITQDGLLSLSYSVNGGAAQTVINKQSITESNGPLPASFRFGFSGGTGGSSNVHEITCFKAAPVNQSSSSAGTNVQQSARVEAGTQVYLSYYHPTNSWGELTAQDLVSDPTTGIVSINQVANWDASCVLTGGTCQATRGTNTAQASGSRNMLSWSGTAGIAFKWDQLTAAQTAALTAGDSSQTDIRLRYLRGDRSNELASTGGTLRTRTGVLGDIVDSSPTWVGPPSLPYKGAWLDALHPTSTAPEAAGSYATFAGATGATAQGGRQNVVYIGANDGFLHGFRSGTYDATGAFVNTTNDGTEVLAYIPAALLNIIHSTTPALDFSSTQYSHNLYADATPGTGDLYYNGAWHTWLVSGVGPGGNATGPIGDKTSIANGVIYALDITDPTQFSEANASTLVRGEWTSGTGTGAITCVGNANCGNNLGSTYGTPIIRRLHNGQWAALFGNGLNSSTGTAGLFIMLVDPASGAISFRFIDTGAGPTKSGTTITARNGMAYVASADLDGDHVTDYVYGGDALGNLWRFDLTDIDPAKWAVSSTPIFKTATGQPITTRVTVSSVQGIGPGGQSGVVLSFGTGQQFPQTQTGGVTYPSATQALYGVWDWNMSAWNAMGGASAQYASLVAPQTVDTTTLRAQSITATAPGSGTISGYRTISTNKVCWKGSSSCSGGASANTQFGWTLPLPSTNNEQVIYNPTTAYGMFLVNTTIPAVSQALTCDTQPAAGYTMAVSLDTGGAPNASFFGDQNGNFVAYNGGIVSGIGLSATGTPSIVTANKWPYLVQQTTGGTGVVTKINPAANGKGSRLTWVKLR